MEEGKWGSIQISGQENITAPCDGKKRCPSQSQFLLEVLEAGALETISQTIRGSSFRCTDRELGFRFPFEPPQCLNAYIYIPWSDHKPAAPWGHSHTLGKDSAQSLFRPHMLCFLVECQLFHTCTQLLCRNPAPHMLWPFFSRYLQPLQCFLNGGLTAVEFLSDFSLVCIRMSCHVCF